MRYLDGKPIPFGSTAAYREGWERTFGKRDDEPTDAAMDEAMASFGDLPGSRPLSDGEAAAMGEAVAKTLIGAVRRFAENGIPSHQDGDRMMMPVDSNTPLRFRITAPVDLDVLLKLANLAVIHEQDTDDLGELARSALAALPPGIVEKARG